MPLAPELLCVSSVTTFYFAGMFLETDTGLNVISVKTPLLVGMPVFIWELRSAVFSEAL